MESLAVFVSFMLLFMLALAVTTLVLSILVYVGKLPKLVGYIAVGVQAVLTIFAFQIPAQMLGLTSLALLAVCSVLVFVDGSKTKK
jgi:hypothetical protein